MPVNTPHNKNQLEEPQKRKSLIEWFYNLPINSKILLTLLGVEIIPLLGLTVTIIVSYIASRGVDSKELEQVKSEVTNIATNYQINADNNAFIFNSQATDSAIQQITALYDYRKVVRDDLAIEVKQTLQNKIEYLKLDNLSLVGTDLKVIVDLKKDKKGKIFNPNNLVVEAIKKQKQIKANLLVKWSEVNQEEYLLPPDLINQYVLIRLTITPIQSRFGKDVTGALVAQEVMNGRAKTLSEISVVKDTALSAIYVYKPSKDFDLIVSNSPNKVTKDFADKSLLKEAVSAPDKIVARRIRVSDQNYLMAAMTLPTKPLGNLVAKSTDLTTNPPTVLAFAVPEKDWTDLSSPKLLVLMVSLTSVLFFSLTILRKAIAKPLVKLENTMRKFTAGDHHVRAEVAYNDEVGVLASRFNEIADKVVEQTEHQNKQITAAQFVNEISSNIHESLDQQKILRSGVIFTREALATDRVIIFKFDENWNGYIVAESVASKWPAALGSNIYDPCFAREYIDKYKKGRVVSIANIYKAELTECHIRLLEQFAVKANIVAPILINGKLYGLLIAHHCSKPREWQDVDKQLLQQVSAQIGLALVNANVLSKIQAVAVQNQSTNSLPLNLSINNQEQEIITLNAFREPTLDNYENFKTFSSYISQIDSLLAENKPEIEKILISQQEFLETTYTIEKLEELTGVVIEINRKIGQVFDISNQTNQNVNDSRSIIESIAQEFYSLLENLVLTTHQIEELNESTQQIYQAIRLVNKIDTQINLLDLNSNIETDNNEDEPKSNAKLLKDIRYVASYSKVAAQDIEEILSSIPRKINLVMQSIEKSNLQVTNEFVMIEENKQKLNIIQDKVQQINTFAHSINQATGSQRQTLQTAIQSLEEVTIASKYTKSFIYKISTLLQELTLLSKKLQTEVKIIKPR